MTLLARLRSLFRRSSTEKQDGLPSSPIEGFRVTCDAIGIHLAVNPPLRKAWSDDIPWNEIIRICHEIEDPLLTPDKIYVFSSEREESGSFQTAPWEVKNSSTNLSIESSSAPACSSK